MSSKHHELTSTEQRRCAALRGLVSLRLVLRSHIFQRMRDFAAANPGRLCHSYSYSYAHADDFAHSDSQPHAYPNRNPDPHAGCSWEALRHQ